MNSLHPITITETPVFSAVPAEVSIITLLDAETLPEWMNLDCLNEMELARFQRTTHPSARERFRRGRILLRNILGSRLGIPPSEVPLALTVDGKPILEGHSLNFNMSHTEGVLLLAMSERLVGVDVERPANGRDLAGLVHRYFSEVERIQFDAIRKELQPEAFLCGWTCKEALLKAIGSGMRDVQNCTVELDPRLPPRVLKCPIDGKWEMFTWKIGDVSAAVCVASA